MFWIHEFRFMSVGYLIGGLLKSIVPELEEFYIGDLPIHTFLY